ncbi:uncharacterized protein EDB91DRAFT_1139516 [Suillus paluster]|uniref:uncharacterized protein n=1 Tax=Suillus paluster TaxID=48578 RepID=UPI001B881D7A|nr:uncharacterized protein EDB91DRAFT_1139516 [Suillus paluster]KAG1737863.1 hypothetical protein EDB91DRAFT_1139516 [Suillus paluster]
MAETPTYELLLVILKAVADDVQSSDHELSLGCVTLASVCRRWRSLVLSTSRFWTRMHMSIQSKLDAFPREHLERNVKRSGNALVDVVIHIAWRPHTWNPQAQAQTRAIFGEAKKCLRLLRECSHKWRSLRIIKEGISPTDLFDSVLSELGFPLAPALKKVEIISGDGGDWATLVKEPFQFLSSALTPSLKTLILKGCELRILRHFDASSLTHLSLSKCSDTSSSIIIFRNLLSSARNLVSLELYPRVVLVGHSEMDTILRPVILPSLRTLSIIMGTEKPSYLSDILRTIATPNLHHLAVYGDSLISWDEDSLPDFSSPAFFLRRDQTSKFPSNILQSMHGPGKNLRFIFTAFPQVTEVVFDHDVREIADQLALESYDQTALPPWRCLRQVTIEMSSMTKFCYLSHLSERLPLPAVVIRYELQRIEVARDARDSTAIKRIVNDTTGYCASGTREVVKQLGKLGAFVDLRVDLWTE